MFPLSYGLDSVLFPDGTGLITSILPVLSEVVVFVFSMFVAIFGDASSGWTITGFFNWSFCIVASVVCVLNWGRSGFSVFGVAISVNLITVSVKSGIVITGLIAGLN